MKNFIFSGIGNNSRYFGGKLIGKASWQLSEFEVIVLVGVNIGLVDQLEIYQGDLGNDIVIQGFGKFNIYFLLIKKFYIYVGKIREGLSYLYIIG